MAKSKGSSQRSAKTGRYVTDKYGKSHPSTTVKETNKKKQRLPSLAEADARELVEEFVAAGPDADPRAVVDEFIEAHGGHVL